MFRQICLVALALVLGPGIRMPDSKRDPNPDRPQHIPDLTVKGQLPAGKDFVWPLQVRVENKSMGPSKATTLEIQFKKHRRGKYKTLMATKTVAIPALDANSAYVVPGLGGSTVTCPASIKVTGGKIFKRRKCKVILTIDPNKQVTESDEDNNVTTLRINKVLHEN